MASTSKSLAQMNKSQAVSRPPSPPIGASSLSEFMTSANSLSLILRRLDEIERKLDHALQELRTPAAIGYPVRRGNLPKKD